MRRRRFLGLAGAGTLGAAISWQQSLAGADDRARAGDFDPTERSIADLQTLLGGSLTSAALVTAYLARIARLDAAGPTYRSVLAVNPDALAAARALDAERRAGKLRGPLHGIPILIKDNIATRDPLPTTAGSYALARAFHRTDAALVARLRAAGAVVLGKTNLSEWANFRSTRSSSGWSAVGGQTGNAYDVARNPSGSSSGSGTAAALRLGVGFVPVRKGGKLPVKKETAVFRDYSNEEKSLELRANPWPAGTRVLLIDEWIETGTQARAAAELVERAGGVIAGIAAIAFRRNERTAPLWARYRCHGLWPEQP